LAKEHVERVAKRAANQLRNAETRSRMVAWVRGWYNGDDRVTFRYAVELVQLGYLYGLEDSLAAERTTSWWQRRLIQRYNDTRAGVDRPGFLATAFVYASACSIACKLTAWSISAVRARNPFTSYDQCLDTARVRASRAATLSACVSAIFGGYLVWTKVELGQRLHDHPRKADF
jgi:hypothetical protein